MSVEIQLGKSELARLLASSGNCGINLISLSVYRIAEEERFAEGKMAASDGCNAGAGDCDRRATSLVVAGCV